MRFEILVLVLSFVPPVDFVLAATPEQKDVSDTRAVRSSTSATAAKLGMLHAGHRDTALSAPRIYAPRLNSPSILGQSILELLVVLHIALAFRNESLELIPEAHVADLR